MAIFRSTGPINFDDVQEFFGQTRGSAFNLDSYYRGGGIVPATGPNSGQAAIHQIAVDPNASSSGASTGTTSEQFAIRLDNAATSQLTSVTLSTLGPAPRDTNTAIIPAIPAADRPTLIFRTDGSNTAGIPATRLYYYFSTDDEVVAFANQLRIPYAINTTNEGFRGAISQRFQFDYTGNNDLRPTIRVTQGSLTAEADIRSIVIVSEESANPNVFRRVEIFVGDITTNDTGFVDGDDVTIEFINPTFTASSVTIDIPTDNVNETLELPGGLRTDQEIHDAITTAANSNDNISRNWVATTGTIQIEEPNFIDTGFQIIQIDSLGLTGPVASRDLAIRMFDQNTLDSRYTIGTQLRYQCWNRYLIDQFVEISAEPFLDENDNDRLVIPITFLTDNFERYNGNADRTFTPLFIEDGTTSMVDRTATVFTARDTTNHTIGVDFNINLGAVVRQEILQEIRNGDSAGPSEIRLDFGDGVVPGSESIILGEQNSQGIADAISEVLDGNGQLYATSGTNLVTIEDSRQRPRILPTVTILEAGTSGLTNADFTVTEVQPGMPTEMTTAYLTIEYSLGDIAATTTGWNFHDAIDGAMTTLSTWPTTGDVFLHIGLSDVVLDDIEATLGLAEITQTMQDVTDATLTFSFNFLDLTPATSRYSLTGIRLVSTSTGTALGVRLDGTTGIQSLTNTDPLFEDEQVVGLTFFRRQIGDINTDIPDDPIGGTFPPIDLSNFYNANDGSTL